MSSRVVLPPGATHELNYYRCLLARPFAELAASFRAFHLSIFDQFDIGSAIPDSNVYWHCPAATNGRLFQSPLPHATVSRYEQSLNLQPSSLTSIIKFPSVPSFSD